MKSYEFEYALNKNYVSRRVKIKRNSTYLNYSNETIVRKIENREKSNENLNVGFKKSNNLSQSSIKKIKDAIQWLDHYATKKVYVTKNGKKIKHRLSFITLTLASGQTHDDKLIVKKCLNSWLTNMRANYGMRNYIWRAEAQENGNIHFHIITDANPNHYHVLYSWNKAQNLLGYVDEFKTKFQTEDEPPSTQVKRLSNSIKIERYITKYMTKKADQTDDEETENQRIITSRHYAISYELTRLRDFREHTRDIAELMYTYTQTMLRGKEVVKEYFGYIVIKISRLYAHIDGLQNELKKRFYESTKFRNSRTILNSNYSPVNNYLIFDIA